MKIRIFALARELGLDSKVLLGLADEAGIKLRNALATITPEERDTIVAFVKNRGEGDSSPEEADASPAPSRPSVNKTRDIRVMPSKAAADEQVEEAEEAVEGEAEAEAEEAPVEAEVEVSEDAAEEVVAESDVAPAAEEDSASEPEEAADESDNDGESTEEAASETPTDEPAEDSPREPTPQKAPTPIQRMSKPVRREMRPISNVKDENRSGAAASTPETPKKEERAPVSPRMARPMVATPNYQPPAQKQKPKKAEEKVQKPDISMDQIVAPSTGTLAEKVRQIKEERARMEGTPAGKRRSKSGSLLKDFNKAREKQRLEKKQRRRKRSAAQAELKTSAQIECPITVRNLSEAIGRPARSIVSYFFKAGKMLNINDDLTEDDALEVAMELGVDLEIKRGRDIEAELVASLDHEDTEEDLEWRPPIVTILGHVDHGKTTLVDKLRQANVAAGEAGGITQHIAAYQVIQDGKPVTFVDTPGHAAFGEMRARGANVTDIIILVIAADDGIMPQTEECIAHAKSAGVPIIVAMNKMDLPDIDEQKTLQQLASHDMLPAEWGGEYEVIRTSGETGQGLEDLVETIQITADLLNYQANPDREAVGVCLEAFRDEGKGVIAWFIVQKGTLQIGDNILCGTTYGRIRAMYDDRGRKVKEAGPSTPVKVAGLNEVPTAGVHFFGMPDIEEARQVAESRIHEGRESSLSGRGKPLDLDGFLEKVRSGEGAQKLPIILKADTPGSVEALRGELNKFEHPEVEVQIIYEAVGGVNESDIFLASGAGAIIVAFHVIADEKAQQLAEREGVDIRRYNIIYEVTEYIRQSLEGLLRPEKKEVTTGRAIVLRTFSISRFGTIAGCRVLNGTISRDSRIHVIRDNTVLNNYRIGSLKREKDDAKEVREGMECGIRLDGFNDVKEGDLLEAFRIDEIQRTLS